MTALHYFGDKCVGTMAFGHLGPLHTRGQETVTMTVTLQPLSLVEKAELVQVRFTLSLRDPRSKCMHDGYKVYMDSYMAPDGSYFTITWTIFENNLFKVSLTQNRETMALRTLTTVDLFYCLI